MCVGRCVVGSVSTVCSTHTHTHTHTPVAPAASPCAREVHSQLASRPTPLPTTNHRAGGEVATQSTGAHKSTTTPLTRTDNQLPNCGMQVGEHAKVIGEKAAEVAKVCIKMHRDTIYTLVYIITYRYTFCVCS